MWAWPTAVHVRPRVRWQARRPPLGPSGPPCAGLCQSPSAAQARRLQSPARAPPGAAAGIRYWCPGTSETVGWVPKAGLTDTTPVQPHLALLAHRVLNDGRARTVSRSTHDGFQNVYGGPTQALLFKISMRHYPYNCYAYVVSTHQPERRITTYSSRATRETPLILA